jgi:hypothetical protein
MGTVPDMLASAGWVILPKVRHHCWFAQVESEATLERSVQGKYPQTELARGGAMKLHKFTDFDGPAIEFRSSFWVGRSANTGCMLRIGGCNLKRKIQWVWKHRYRRGIYRHDWSGVES